MQGWIKLHRKVQEHWIYQERRKFSKYEAWIDLLMMASHKDTKFVHGKELIEIEKGSFVTSELKLMDKWDWGKARLRSFLEILEKDGMIVKKSDRKKTTITICNYCIFNDSETENRPLADHEQTTGRPSADTIKNVKNVKNDKEEKIIAEIKDLRRAYSPEVIRLIDQYWTVIKKTRKTNQVSYNVILKTMHQWQKFEELVIHYALKKHIESFDDGEHDEKYTLGIMRNTPPEQALDLINKKTYKPRFKVGETNEPNEYDNLF